MSIINNHNNNMKTLIPVIPATRLFLITLACLALVRLANAVSPPPDGGYPGWQHSGRAERSLKHLTMGGLTQQLVFAVRSPPATQYHRSI